MKKLFAIILFLLFYTSYSFAQEDTTFLSKPADRNHQELKNSLIDNNETFITHPLSPNYRRENILFQNQDTPTEIRLSTKTNISNAPYSKFIIPVTLISYGIATRFNNSLRQLDYSTHNKISEHFKKQTTVDDYLQFAPAISVLALDLTGVAKAKHNFGDRIFIMSTSYLVMGVAVETMKCRTDVKRPNDPSFKSFPSGHTATAFVGAHILFKEYKDTSPWIAVAGYATASTTGALRVFNKKHWVSDVVCGAGIGILSAEIGYMLLPVFHSIIGTERTNNNLAVAPIVSTDSYGVGLAYHF